MSRAPNSHVVVSAALVGYSHACTSPTRLLCSSTSAWALCSFASGPGRSWQPKCTHSIHDMRLRGLKSNLTEAAEDQPARSGDAAFAFARVFPHRSLQFSALCVACLFAGLCLGDKAHKPMTVVSWHISASLNGSAGRGAGTHTSVVLRDCPTCPD